MNLPKILPFLALALAACSSHPGDASSAGESADTEQGAAQVNDVSILFPLAKSQSELAAGYVPAAAQGAKGTVLPLTLVKDNGFVWPDDHQPVLAGGQLNQLRYPELRVVSMRLDPCAAHIGAITDGAACQAQMRLVLEDVTMDAQAHLASAHDAALHAGYSLTRDELTAALKEVIALRVAQAQSRDLGPLAPHPVMAEQGLGGAMAAGIRKIILEYCGEQNLARVTRLAVNGYDSPFHPQDWLFQGFNMVNGQRQNVSISALPPSTNAEKLTPVSHVQLRPNDVIPAFDPRGPSVDDISSLRDMTTANAASPDARQAALDSTLKIDSPAVHSFDTIDCASCHASQPFRVVIGEKGLSMSSTTNPNRFDPAKLVGAAAAASTFTPTDTANFHAFSYKLTTASISQRLVNETANVVAYVNPNILGVHPN
jgi:hypothetical protein